MVNLTNTLVDLVKNNNKKNRKRKKKQTSKQTKNNKLTDIVIEKYVCLKKASVSHSTHLIIDLKPANYRIAVSLNSQSRCHTVL